MNEKNTANEITPWEAFTGFLEQLVWGVPRFLLALAVVIFSFWLAKFVSKIIINRISDKLGADEGTAQVITLIKRTVNIIIITLGGLLALFGTERRRHDFWVSWFWDWVRV